MNGKAISSQPPTLGRNLSNCHRCPRRQRKCAGACACLMDGVDIIVHASAGDCPLGRHERVLARGLGDWVARWAKRIGADRVSLLFRRMTGRQCGCHGRQERLNKLIPFHRTLRIGVERHEQGRGSIS
jgi:hypothetical protein